MLAHYHLNFSTVVVGVIIVGGGGEFKALIAHEGRLQINEYVLEFIVICFISKSHSGQTEQEAVVYSGRYVWCIRA